MGVVIPPRAPNGLPDIIAHYGDPKITRATDGSWQVDQAWERQCCISTWHTLLSGPKHALYVHRLVEVPLLRLLDRWQARINAGDPYQLRTIGCFQPRAQRGSNGLLASTHSWAIAFDLNADDNPMIIGIDPDDPRRQTAKDIPDAWIDDARAEGWFWGGDFSHRFDPQHFQMATGY